MQDGLDSDYLSTLNNAAVSVSVNHQSDSHHQLLERRLLSDHPLCLLHQIKHQINKLAMHCTPRTPSSVVNVDDPRDPLLGRDNCASTVCRIRRNRSVRDPDVNQWLHGLQIFRPQKTKQQGDGDVVHKGGVEVAVRADVPERMLPVRVIQVCVDAEHLTEDCLDVSEEGFRESGRLAHPVASSQRCGWSGQSGRAHCDGSSGTRSGDSTVCSRRINGWFGREGFRIMDLAHDPTLYKADVLRRGYFDRDFLVIEPSVGVAAIPNQESTRIDQWIAYRPADMVGHVSW